MTLLEKQRQIADEEVIKELVSLATFKTMACFQHCNAGIISEQT